MNAIDKALAAIADAILGAQRGDGLWDLGKEQFYRLSQTTFGCRVLLWQGGSHAGRAQQALNWLNQQLASDKVLHYPRTLAWPLYLFSNADSPLSSDTSAHLTQRLCQLQNLDGSWGHGTNPPASQGSGIGHPFPTALGMLALSHSQDAAAAHSPVSDSIRLGVRWLRTWLQNPHKPQPASTALALVALHASDSHDIPPKVLQSETSRLVADATSGKTLEPEIIPNAARRLDAPYILLSPAWVLLAINLLGDLSSFRTQLELVQHLLTLVKSDGRVGVTPEDPSPHIYPAFNVYLALRTFRSKYMQDELLNTIIKERDAMQIVTMGPPKSRAKVFVGSSIEGLNVARTIQTNFDHDPFDTIIWENGLFTPSLTTIEALEDAAEDFDFAILVLTPDGIEASRGEIHPVIRDNVVFELGMFIGALGRDHVFMLHPREPFKGPSDLAGITMVSYDPTRFEVEPQAALGPACDTLRNRITRLGTRP